MCFLLLVFLLPLLQFCSCSVPVPEPKIVGGTLVRNRAEFPYQVLVVHDESYCGGSIIGDKQVLTAAHCCFTGDLSRPVEPRELRIVVGNLNIDDFTNVKQVSNITVHKEYNESTFTNDIALLRISGVFENTSNVKPINLARLRYLSGSCNVSGWGTTSSGSQGSSNLLYVEVPIVDWHVCKNSYNFLTDTQICAGEQGKDSCQGDSGGPLVCDGNLAGIVSYGVGCAEDGFPGVYTEVAQYLDWIKEASASADKARNSIILLLLAMTLAALNKLFI